MHLSATNAAKTQDSTMTSRSHDEPIRQLQSYWQTVKPLILVGLASFRSQFLLDVSVHIIPFIPISKADLRSGCCPTYAFISSIVNFFFSSSTLYVAMFLLLEKPATFFSAYLILKPKSCLPMRSLML